MFWLYILPLRAYKVCVPIGGMLWALLALYETNQMLDMAVEEFTL